MFEYKETVGPVTGNPANHIDFVEKYDGEKVRKICEEYGIDIKFKTKLIVHHETYDSHSLEKIFSSKEESDLVAFKLLWI